MVRVGEEVEGDVVSGGKGRKVGGEEDVPALTMLPLEDAEEDERMGRRWVCGRAEEGVG